MVLLNPTLLEAWSGGKWKPGPPREISGMSIDTRALVAGNLFVAIKGPRYDGHDFLEHAFEKGAAAALVSRPAEPLETSRPLLWVKNTADALRSIAAGHRKRASAKVIAVTGSFGKTTVKEMVADVLSRAGLTARTPGNWNNELGLPLSLLAMEEASRFGVFEAGMNHPGELRVLCELLLPDWGIITGVGPVHLEHFGSVRSIALEKSALIRSLPNDGAALLRKDQDWFGLLKARARCPVVTLAMDGEADFQGSYLPDREERLIVAERDSAERFEFKLPIPGRHVAENALFAVSAGRLHGLGWASIAEALASFKPQPMRWQTELVGGVRVINDAYNAHPRSMTAALQTFAMLDGAENKWLILGGMLELGGFEKKAHLELGRAIAEGDWAGLIGVGRLGSLIADGAEGAGMKNDRIFRAHDAAEAADIIKRLCSDGDAVLLKASRGERLESVLAEWRKD